MPDPAIVASSVGRRFGGRWAIRNVTLTVEPGQSVLVHGANGSGKTTLLRVLASAISPTAGTVTLHGEPAIEARRLLGLLSHADGHYDELSGRDNLDLAVRLGRLPDRVDEVLDRVGLRLRAGDPVRGYSAGMRKRLSFARLLLKAPKVVFLDEPYAALDPAGHTFVDELCAEFAQKGTTVLISTHQVGRVAQWCERAIQMDAGALVWSGDASTLRTSAAVSAVAAAEERA
jgi:heme exporter protein A